MGEFHRQGLAKEFNMIGSEKYTIVWRKGDTDYALQKGWDTNVLSPEGRR